MKKVLRKSYDGVGLRRQPNEPTMNAKLSKVALVNNTNADTSEFSSIFVASIINETPLPEEIADLFNLRVIEVEDGLRGILDFA
jgi:hypothetical protein